MIAKALLLTIVCIFHVQSSKIPDYYWRDYNDGVIPEDALPAGRNENGTDIYIAQIYCHNRGLFVGPINPDQNETEFACEGPQKSDTFLKILCTHHKASFYWLPTDSWHFRRDTSGKHLVVGGFRADGGVHNIGRSEYDEITQIGPTDSWNIRVHCYFGYEDQEHCRSEFEVLVYDETRHNEYNFDIKEKE